jgi:hypothetical protein
MAEATDPETGDRPSTEEDGRLAIADHVTFHAAGDPVFEPSDAAADLVAHIRRRAKAGATSMKARPHRSHSGAVSVRLYWQGGRFHTVRIASGADGRLLVSHNGRGGRDLSLTLHDWLVSSERYSDIRWRTSDDWRAGEAGRGEP